MMRTIVALIAALSVVSWNATAAEKMYKWVDDRGNVSYHDRPPPANSGYRVEEREVRAKRTTGSGDSSQAPVVLYSITKCAPCDSAREHLKRRNVPFSEKNVEKDLKLQEELKKKVGTLTVPVLTIGSKVLNSYAAGWLDSELDQAGYGATDSKSETEEESDKPAGDSGFKAPTE